MAGFEKKIFVLKTAIVIVFEMSFVLFKLRVCTKYKNRFRRLPVTFRPFRVRFSASARIYGRAKRRSRPRLNIHNVIIYTLGYVRERVFMYMRAGRYDIIYVHIYVYIHV